jgi:hypothetical protein
MLQQHEHDWGPRTSAALSPMPTRWSGVVVGVVVMVGAGSGERIILGLLVVSFPADWKVWWCLYSVFSVAVQGCQCCHVLAGVQGSIMEFVSHAFSSMSVAVQGFQDE